MTRQSIVLVCALVLIGFGQQAFAAPATLNSGEAYIDAFSFTGAAASSVTIDERIEWDGSGSSFNRTIDEQEDLAGTFSGATVDNTIQTFVTQDTQIDGTVGGGFSGVTTTASANGSVIKRGPNGGSTNNFLKAELSLAFTVTDPDAEYSLTGLLESSNSSVTSVTVLLRKFVNGLPSTTPLISGISRQSPEFPFAFDVSGPIAQGDWLLELKINSGASGSEPVPSTSTADFAWQADFVITPEPTTAAALGLGALVLLRRRR